MRGWILHKHRGGRGCKIVELLKKMVDNPILHFFVKASFSVSENSALNQKGALSILPT
jgi:hypothetical protein